MNEKRKGRLLVLLSAMVLAGGLCICIIGQRSSAGNLSVWVSYGEQGQEISCWQEEGSNSLFLFLPSAADTLRWKIKDGESFWLDGERIENGSEYTFESGTTHSLFADGFWGLFGKHYTLTLLQSAQTASAFLVTETGKMDYVLQKKGNGEGGGLLLVDEAGNVDYAGAFAEIRGRGNYTWLLDKKSFSLDFIQEQGLLGMSEAAQWVLMAGAAEDTHLINRMVFEMMREAGISGVQESTWVDLYLNGEYAGNYLLSQKVQLQQENQNGGWMVEFDGYWKEEGGIGFDTQAGEAVAIKYPAAADAAQQAEIAGFVQQVENAVLRVDGVDQQSGRSWQELADMDSLVKKYVLDEISKCPDGWNGSNYCFLRDGKLYFGSPWDYEFSFGNQPSWFSDLKLPHGLYHREETSWYNALYKKEEFLDAVKETYRDFFRPYLLAQADSVLERQAQRLEASMTMDMRRWGRPEENFHLKVADLKNYIRDRLSWLDQEWLGMTAAEETTYYALHLMDGDEEYAVYYIREGSFVEEDMLVREEEHFTGWYEDTDCTIPADRVTEPVDRDIYLYAGWDRTASRIRLFIHMLPLGFFLLVLAGFTLMQIRGFKRRKKK